jgi:hypothetical protein
MDDSELFDVFDVDNNPEPVQKGPVAPIERTKSQKHRSKDNKPDSNGIASGKRPHDKQDDQDVEERTMIKKSRKNIEDPVVVDSFETESEQIVPATMGLQGTAPTDANIVIKKRVSPESPQSIHLRNNRP